MEAIVAGGAALAARTCADLRGLCVRLPGSAQMEIAAGGTQVKLAVQLLRALAEGPRPY
jgi:hypothetical protein